MRPFTGLTQGFGVLKGMTPLIGTLGLALLLGGLARPGRNGNGIAPAAGDYAAFAPSPQSNAAYQAIYQESVAMHTSIGDYAVTETVQTANTTPVVQTASASVVNAANANGSATQEVPGYAF